MVRDASPSKYAPPSIVLRIVKIQGIPANSGNFLTKSLSSFESWSTRNSAISI